MNEKWPFNRQTIGTPGNIGASSINPMPSVPGEQFMRSIDPPATGGGGPGGGGGFDGDWPLKLVQVDAENVKVLLGTVSGETPASINTNLDVSSVDGTWAIYMAVTISGTTASSPVVVPDSSGTVPSDDTTNSYRLIGEVDVASSVITEVRPSMAWSQNVAVCTADSPPYYWTTGS